MATDPAAVEAELQALTVALQNLDITKYFGAVGLTVLLYDHLLTFVDEVEFVWTARLSFPKLIFLAIRYLVPTVLGIYNAFLSGFTDLKWTTQVCRAWISLGMMLGWFTIGLSNFLVLLRIYAIIPRRHQLVVPTFIFFIVIRATSFAVDVWTVVEMVPLIQFNDTVQSCEFSSRPNLAGLWVAGLAFEVVIFCVMWWNTLSRPRNLEANEQVTKMLQHDGIVYFVLLTSLRITNTVLSIVAPATLLFVGVFVIWAGTTIVTSRLVINSRKATTVSIAEAEDGQRLREVRVDDAEEEEDNHPSFKRRR
uniref:DUF6533 domain-containing protein n=1 Tax=Mycena chlorophos TaxID=658473 RepID=A0ABQ0LY87_MYCCL|nr:predicted protein [Mycena chlorophos]